MKTNSDNVLSSLVMIPIMAALIGVITLLAMTSVKAQSLETSGQEKQVTPIKLHVSAPLRMVGGHLQPMINLGVRNNRNEWSLTTSLGTTNPIRLGFGGAYTRFLQDDKRVFQPYVRFEAEHFQYDYRFIADRPVVGITAISAMIGTRIYPFKEGLHLDIAAGPSLRSVQAISGNTAGIRTSGWSTGLNSRFAIGYDIPLSGKNSKNGRRRVRADMRGK